MPAAIPLAMVAASGISAYAASRSNANATQAQLTGTREATQAQTQANEEALAYQRQQDQIALQRQIEAERNNYGQYQNRANAARSLGQHFGFDIGAVPDYSPSQFAQGANGQRVAMPNTQMSAQDQTLGDWLRSGMDPAQAIQRFNQQYGRTTGNEATFSHDNTIAVPSGYYATGQNGWQFAPGDHSGGSGSSNRPQLDILAALQTPEAQFLSVDPLAPPPARTRTLGAYFGAR